MSPIKINKTLTVSVAAILIAIGALYYLFFYPNYDQELRETSARINSLVNIELNIDNAADITYADLSKKIEQYISETEGIYARVKKSGDSGSRDEKIIIEYLSASLKFQRAMKLRYHTENLSRSLSKQATEVANSRMNTPYYTGGNPMAALNSFNASMAPIWKLLSEASEAEEKAANAKQSFFAATKLLITATQKAISMAPQDNLVNLPLLEKIYVQAVIVKPVNLMTHKLDTFTVELSDKTSNGKLFLQTDVTLILSNMTGVLAIQQSLPEIRGKIIRLLSSKQSSQISDGDGKTQLSNEIRSVINGLTNGRANVTGASFDRFNIL